MPATRREYWGPKLMRNKSRDAGNRQELAKRGWAVLTVWECQVHPRKVESLAQRLSTFLQS